jgi:hypothetical protein
LEEAQMSSSSALSLYIFGFLLQVPHPVLLIERRLLLQSQNLRLPRIPGGSPRVPVAVGKLAPSPAMAWATVLQPEV